MQRNEPVLISLYLPAQPSLDIHREGPMSKKRNREGGMGGRNAAIAKTERGSDELDHCRSGRLF